MNKYLSAILIFTFPLYVFAQKKQVKKAKPVTKTTAPVSDAVTNIQAPLKLWYESPANYFEESMVLGNGTQGATVFGGISLDKIYLNDLTLWSGEPVNANMNPQAYKKLPDVRKALEEKTIKKRSSLSKIAGQVFRIIRTVRNALN